MFPAPLPHPKARYETDGLFIKLPVCLHREGLTCLATLITAPKVAVVLKVRRPVERRNGLVFSASFASFSRRVRSSTGGKLNSTLDFKD